MGVLPQSVIGQIQFCESHVPVWTPAPATIGLSAGQCSSLDLLTKAARGAFDDALAAREASKAATTALHAAAAPMRASVADLIRQIKAYAELQPNPATVYAAAQIPPPAGPTPLPAPGKPTNFSVSLQPDGSVTLSWDAAEAAASSGAFFMVSRKLPGEGGFSGIGGCPGITSEARRASFNDATVPPSAASAGAQYIVQGFRGTRAGLPSDAVTVQFGVDGEGVSLGGGGLSLAA